MPKGCFTHTKLKQVRANVALERRAIPGFRRKYLADRTGGIWSQNPRRKVELKLNQYIDGRGYYVVKIYYQTRSVHRLLLLTFVGRPPFRNAHTRHLNGNPLDNRLENLAWGTAKDNAADRIRHGTVLRGSAVYGAKLNDSLVRKIRRLYAIRHNITALARRFGVWPRTILYAATGRTWKHVI